MKPKSITEYQRGREDEKIACLKDIKDAYENGKEEYRLELLKDIHTLKENARREGTYKYDWCYDEIIELLR